MRLSLNGFLKFRLQGLPLDMFPWWMSKLDKGDSIHIKDDSLLPEEASAEKEILETQDIKSLIVLPLYTDNGLSGFIGLDNVMNTGEWEEEDIEFLRTISYAISARITASEYI